jgi:cytochrome c-type biogenesis protein CcmH/NrfG
MASPPEQTPKKAESAAGSYSPKLVGVILGTFFILSIVTLAVTWRGYQLSRRTNLAEDAIREKRYEDAIPHLKFVLEQYPTAWVRLTQLGDAYLETGKADQALKIYEQSLRLAPDQKLDARIGRAHFLLRHDDKAIEHLQKVQQEDPNNPEANFYIALYYMREKKFRRAGDFFRMASADPEFFKRSKPYLEEIRRTVLEAEPKPAVEGEP